MEKASPFGLLAGRTVKDETSRRRSSGNRLLLAQVRKVHDDCVIVDTSCVTGRRAIITYPQTPLIRKSSTLNRFAFVGPLRRLVLVSTRENIGRLGNRAA